MPLLPAIRTRDVSTDARRPHFTSTQPGHVAQHPAFAVHNRPSLAETSESQPQSWIGAHGCLRVRSQLSVHASESVYDAMYETSPLGRTPPTSYHEDRAQGHSVGNVILASAAGPMRCH